MSKEAIGLVSEFHPVSYAKLLIDVIEVIRDRMRRDVEQRGDLLVRVAFRCQFSITITMTAYDAWNAMAARGRCVAIPL